MPNSQGNDPKTLDVLVVDDEPEIGSALADRLRGAGLTSRAVTGGSAALGLLREGWQVSVVVSDLRMPELDGLQFAEHLQRLSPANRPDLIFMSGHAGFDDAVEAIRLQARDLLTKPVDGERLTHAVKSVLLGREARSAASPAPARARSKIEQRRAILESLQAVRKVRSRYFPSELFSDPCWEMLLDLYDARLAGQDVTVTSLAAASGAPTTTAWRRLASLRSHGLIENAGDPTDKRRTIVRLTGEGLQAVEGFIETYAKTTQN